MASWGLHWFRHDLRLAGNPALRANLTRHDGRVLGFFCFDSQFLARPDFSVDRFAFFLKTLGSLREELRAAGGDLLVWDARPMEAFPKLLQSVSERPALVSFNRDYEPFARARDLEVRELLESRGVETLTARDHLVFEPDEIAKASGEGGYYSVFTPFARRWFEALHRPEGRARIEEQRRGLAYLKARAGGKEAPALKLRWADVLAGNAPTDALEFFLQDALAKARVPIPEGGSLEAFRALERFRPKLKEYTQARDLPSCQGTSRLSIFFKNGSLTIAQAIAFLGLENEKLESKGGAAVFLKELCWREFYYHILWHRPDVEQGPYHPQYAKLAWENDPVKFKAWQEGQTGYPIVDAAMRELATTGWMHNRARMIVASFLTKDLLIDWRWGERWFMERLLDGDLAPNNGGWQWAASTGCDPQPYFRIFNPRLQSEKFDESGDYIRRFVPELAELADKEIHDPDPLTRGRVGYPNPIVDHALARDRAIRLYKDARPVTGEDPRSKRPAPRRKA